jgi:ATP synthase protein I
MLPAASGGVRTAFASTAGSAMSGDDARHEREQATGLPTDGDLSRRLERLGANLDAKRPAAKPETAPAGTSEANRSAIGQAFRFSAEFVAGVMAGGIAGWLVDRLVGSSPWGLIVCLILGFCAGMLNLLRAAGTVQSVREIQREEGGLRKPPDQPRV